MALTVPEHQELEQLWRRGTPSARTLTRARILLRAAEGLTDEEIAEEVATSVPSVERTRQRFVAEHFGALTERPRPGRPPVFQESGQARLIAEAGSTAPGGRERWTLELLADRGVELGLAEACSADTVGRVLTKTRSPPGSSRQGGIPEGSAEFVAQMEDVSDLYAEPSDPPRPEVNFDETSKQLLADTRAPLPARAGQPRRYASSPDYS